ncbi:hypothetical protein ACFVR1_14795 [Psychrobacillus sp. NPDC058041]|uniref:hypothetical protein n=1 Tax=Psychrobacillus sp. NPDC058041 TaxID=3346310 RepID=UPI0036DD7334
MGTKIIDLLIPSITPVMFFLAAQVAYDFGVAGLLGFSIMLAISFYIIYLLKNKKVSRIHDPLLKKLVYSLYFIETSLSIFLVGKIIFSEAATQYFQVIIIILVLVATIFVLFLRKFEEKWVSTSTIVLGLIVSFLIPTLVYLRVSIPTVYSGLHFLSRDMLTININESIFLILGLGIILVAHQYGYHTVYEKVKIGHKSRSFIIAGLISANVLIAFGSISFLGRAQAVFPDLSDRVSMQVMSRFGGQFGQLLFVSTSIFISIYVVIRLWKTMQNESSNYRSLSFFYYLFFPLIIVVFWDLTLLDIFLFFGLIWGPLYSVIIWPSESSVKTRISFIAGLVLSIVFFTLYDVIIGILAGTISSILIVRLMNMNLYIKKA